MLRFATVGSFLLLGLAVPGQAQGPGPAPSPHSFRLSPAFATVGAAAHPRGGSMQRWRPDSGASGQETASLLGGAAFGLFAVLWLPERESATVGLLALGGATAVVLSAVPFTPERVELSMKRGLLGTAIGAIVLSQLLCLVATCD